MLTGFNEIHLTSFFKRFRGARFLTGIFRNSAFLLNVAATSHYCAPPAHGLSGAIKPKLPPSACGLKFPFACQPIRRRSGERKNGHRFHPDFVRWLRLPMSRDRCTQDIEKGEYARTVLQRVS
jgi:hypothetical protein